MEQSLLPHRKVADQLRCGVTDVDEIKDYYYASGPVLVARKLSLALPS
jgi:hypothetical protein